MLKLLLVDYLSPNGHENFNAIHINALLKLGHSITAIGKKGQFDGVNNNPNFSTMYLPSWCNRPIKILPNIFCRIQAIFTLIYIMNKYKQKYDYSILLCYDILSCFFYRPKTKVVLINHNNVSQFSSKIKLWMTLHLPANYIHVTLNQEMKKRMEELNPYKKCCYVPHGVVQVSTDCKKPLYVGKDEQYLFCPVNRNIDVKLMANIISSEYVDDYLKSNKIKLFIKKFSDIIRASENIFVIDSFLEKAEYDYLIKNALAVILPYSTSFQYRCSGIMFESIAYQTPIIASDIPDLTCFDNDCNISFFSDENSFVEAVNISFKMNNIIELEIFNPMPYWKDILNDKNSEYEYS